MRDEQLKLAMEAEGRAALALLFDLALIAVTLYLALTFSDGPGGWLAFLLLGLSPRSRQTRL